MDKKNVEQLHIFDHLRITT